MREGEGGAFGLPDALLCIAIGVTCATFMLRAYNAGRERGASEIADYVEAYTLGVRRGRAQRPRVASEAPRG